MKKILSQNEIAFLYFKEHEEKTNLVGIINSGTLRTINESSLHFRTFKVKHFFMNQWKHFLNWCEVKFFPEYAVPRFTRTKIKRKKKPTKKS